MISPVLKIFSILMILSALGAIISTLYTLSSDLSKISFNADVYDMSVDSNGLSLVLMLSLNYSGIHELNDFVISLSHDNIVSSSSKLSHAHDVNVINLHCFLPLNYMNKLLNASMSFSLTYAGIIPLSISSPEQTLFPIEVFDLPTGIVTENYNSSHALISATVLSMADISYPVSIVLKTNYTDHTFIFGSFDRYEKKVASWYLPYDEVAGMRELVICVQSDEGPITGFEWRLSND